MIIKINTTEDLGKMIIHHFAMIQAIALDFKPEDLQWKIVDTEPLPRASAARTHYVAKLPQLPDGTFDMAAVDATVKENLLSVGAHTLNGIVYRDVVNATLKGEILTEPAIRAARMMKPGSSQGAVQKLKAMGLIDGLAIKHGEASE